MKVFDCEIAKGMHSEGAYNFLKATHDKPMTEEEFILGYRAVTSSKKHNPASLRRQYRNLKQQFGFFTR
jgi:hypothetical protein